MRKYFYQFNGSGECIGLTVTEGAAPEFPSSLIVVERTEKLPPPYNTLIDGKIYASDFNESGELVILDKQPIEV